MKLAGNKEMPKTGERQMIDSFKWMKALIVFSRIRRQDSERTLRLRPRRSFTEKIDWWH